MRKFVWLLCVLLILTGCAAPAGPESISPKPEVISPGVASSLPGASEEMDVFTPERTLTPEETIQVYFDQQYLAYTSHRYADLSSIVDISQPAMSNSLVWLQTLIQRRRLIEENGFCYVETRSFGYSIRYLDEDEADLRRWPTGAVQPPSQPEPDTVTLYFTITGVPGMAYPPMLSVNSQQNIRLKKMDGVWKITSHSYPGSGRKFRRNGVLELPDEETTLRNLEAEFAGVPNTDTGVVPEGFAAYDGALAAQYAALYTESPNPIFYNIGDWMGNCANFTSQCIWFGFSGGNGMPSLAGGPNMTDSWYAGAGGGSPAWENVGHFWTYATGNSDLKTLELDGAAALRAGDLIQLRTGGFNPQEEEEDEEARFNHSMLVVDGETLLLAQNSPSNFAYYSDLINVRTRMLRPVAVRS